MEIEKLLRDPLTRFADIPGDIKTIIASNILLNPELVILINELCDNDHFICRNRKLYEILTLKGGYACGASRG